MSKPATITTRKILPFAELSWHEFERLCLWLVEREGYMNPQHVGERGSGDLSRDIVAHKLTEKGEELWYFQCKRVKQIGATALRKEIDNYDKRSKRDPLERPTGVIFIITAGVSPGVRDNVGQYCQRKGYACEFWARTELDMHVKKHPDIITEFFDASRAHTVTVLSQLPPIVQDFTGRVEELNELLTKVRTGGAVISGLQGMGGIGKTALAVRLAHELKPDYPDAQIFLDLKGVDSTEHSGVRQNPLSSAEVMWHVVRSFDSNLKRPDSDAEVESAYRTLLNSGSGEQPKRAILLFDNARDAKQVKPLLPPPSCLLLVTSRQRFDLPGMYRKDLDRMQPQEAEELLLVIAPRIGSHAAKIAELCGRLPLALELVARVLKMNDDLSPEEVVERLEKPRSPLRWKELQEVERSFNLSYELLSEDLQKLWRALAVFPESFDTAAAAAIWDLETIGAKDYLVELRGYSLLEWDNEQNRYRQHDLARDFADARLQTPDSPSTDEDERDALQRRHAQHFAQVLAEVDSHYVLGGVKIHEGLNAFDRERANIEAGQVWAREHIERDSAAAQLCMDYPEIGRHVVALRLHPLERIRWQMARLAAAQRLKQSDHESAALANLGIAYSDLGEIEEAIKYYEQSLGIKREIGDRRGEGNVLSNLGIAYYDTGETRKAIEIYEQALSIHRELGNRRAEGEVLGNIGNVYNRLGERRKAIEFHEKDLAIAREIGDRNGESSALGSVGSVYQELGETRRAIEIQKQALFICREIGGKKVEIVQLINIGVAYVDLGETRNAISFYEQALTITREIGDRDMESAALNRLGGTHIDLRETSKAIELCERALSIAREISNRSRESEALGKLGLAYAALRETRKALGFFEQRLAIAREMGDRRDEGSAMWNGALALEELGERGRAVEYAEAALKIYEEMESPDAAEVRPQLAKWRSNQ